MAGEGGWYETIYNKLTNQMTKFVLHDKLYLKTIHLYLNYKNNLM